MSGQHTIEEKRLLVELEAEASEEGSDTFLGAQGLLKRLLFSVAVALLIAVTVLASTSR